MIKSSAIHVAVIAVLFPAIHKGAGDEFGIGAITAQYLVQFQPKLVLTGRDTERLKKAGQLCSNSGLPQERLLLVTADVDNDADLERLVLSTVQTFNQLDVLVNNAGILVIKTSLDTSLEEFDHVMRTNIRAPFYLCKLCMPHLIQSKGNIVNVSSLAGLGVYPEIAVYCISKTALDKLTKELAMDRHILNILTEDLARPLVPAWAAYFFNAKGCCTRRSSQFHKMMGPYAVRHVEDIYSMFTAICMPSSGCPARIRTNILKKAGLNDEESDKLLESDISNHPLGRIGSPLDVAKAIGFLASDDSSFITGETMCVDGGRHAKSV